MARKVSSELQREIDAGAPDVQAQIWFVPPQIRSHRDRKAHVIEVLKRVTALTSTTPTRVELVRRQSHESQTTFWIEAPAGFLAALIQQKDVDTAWTAHRWKL